MTRTQQFIEKNKKVLERYKEILVSGADFHNADTTLMSECKVQTVVYMSFLKNPDSELRIYIGIHKESKKHPLWSDTNPNGYIGTSSLFQTSYTYQGKDNVNSIVSTLKSGWSHLGTVVLESVQPSDYGREDFWIKEGWKRFGISKEALLSRYADSDALKNKYGVGLMLNMQTSKLSNLRKPEVIRKATLTRIKNNSYVALTKAAHTEEAVKRRRDSARASGGLQRFTEAGHSVEARSKARMTMIRSNKYASSTKKAVEAARDPEVVRRRTESRRKSFVHYKLNDGFIGTTSECDAHVGCPKGTCYHVFKGERQLLPKYGEWSFVKLN